MPRDDDPARRQARLRLEDDRLLARLQGQPREDRDADAALREALDGAVVVRAELVLGLAPAAAERRLEVALAVRVRPVADEPVAVELAQADPPARGELGVARDDGDVRI